MKRTRATIAAAFAAFAVAAFAADITRARFPDADAVMVDDVETVVYKPDGTQETTNESRIKILTEKGRREEGVISIGYSARYGKAGISYVKIVGEDGKERTVDVSATTNETTDNSTASMNIYDPMQKKIVCTVPGLKVGDTLVYKTFRTTEKPRVKDLFADISVMEWTMPILKHRFQVKAPAALPLKKMAVRDPLGNVKYSEKKLPDGSILHEWTSENSPQAFAEPDMPPMHKLVQRVLVSTAGGWPEISKWYWDLCKPHLAKTTDAMKETVAKIDPGKDAGVAARTAAIYKWVAQEIRYMGLTMEDTSPGYAPHDVNVTFDNRYGVCRDKAALLAAMLRIAGIDAYPVLIHAGAKMDPEIPMPFFNHAIVAVKAPGDKAANKDGFILMDPTDESSADLFPAYLGDRSYLVATPWGEPLHVSQVASADDNSLSISSKATLERDGSLVVKSTIDFKGINDNAYRGALLRRKPEERRRIFENMLAAAAPGAELLSFEMRPKDLRQTERLIKVKLVYRVSESVLKGETRDELTVPFVSRAFGVANWLVAGNTALEKRRFPLLVSSTAKVDEKMEIDLAGVLEGKPSLPETVKIEGPYSYLREYSVKGGKLTARRTLAVNAVEFSPRQYSALREDKKRVEAADRPRPVFAKNADADANVHVRRIAKSYNVTSPTSWVVTNTVVKEILTYDGKKKSAELKFSYNPAWKNVELVSATVSNRNGRVSSAGLLEKSVFDCGWAASAPRYPASKELVVNLPSVEIGSVISYTVATTVTNAPAPFYTSWSFDVDEPTDEISLDYSDWTGRKINRCVKNPRKIPSEPMQANGALWREVETVSHGSFGKTGELLEIAADVDELEEGEAIEEAAGCKTPEEKIEAIRNWMSKHVRIAGPSLYEVPLAQQLTEPSKVLAERYGTRLDYMRTMCALMRGAGLDADIVFACGDAMEHPRLVERIFKERNTRVFSSAICRVRVRKGGFLGLGGGTTVYFVGVENEYAPLGPSAYAMSHYIEPGCGDIRSADECPAVDGVALGMLSEDKTEIDLSVKENGFVDLAFRSSMSGPAVGAFRKRYAEMLPEDRSRHFQELVGSMSQAAKATSELATDVKSYPATLSFSAGIPDFATVDGDSITLALPGIGGRLFPLTGTVRETPIGLPSRSTRSTTIAKVVFPEGYTEIEHLPSECVFVDPSPAGYGVLRSLKVEKKFDEKGRLVVVVTESEPMHTASHLPAEYFAMLKDWSRISSSRANRTIVVRRKAKQER